LTRCARPSGSLLAGSSPVQRAGARCRTLSGFSPSRVVRHKRKSPGVHLGSLFKYGGEGGIDSLRSPFGQSPRRLVACPTGWRPLSKPGRGFSPSRVVRHRRKSPGVNPGSLFKYGGEGGIDSLRSPFGQSPRRLVACPTGWRPLSKPGRGFSPSRVVRHRRKSPGVNPGSLFKYGGEGGIRTLDTLPYTHFPGVLLQPLGHLTKLSSPLSSERALM
jgi:hypothetical protein